MERQLANIEIYEDYQGDGKNVGWRRPECTLPQNNMFTYPTISPHLATPSLLITVWIEAKRKQDVLNIEFPYYHH